MAIEVQFANFEKRHNSTKIPPSFSTSYMCNMLEETSITNPKITLQDSARNPSVYNYAYIENFGRYYNIEDWATVHGMWVASLKVDVLASYRANIANSTQYVLRSSCEGDGTIADNRYPTIAKTMRVQHNFANCWGEDAGEGCFVVGINSLLGLDAERGAIKYFAMTSDQLKSFMDILMGNTDWFDGDDTLEEISTALHRTLWNPLEYITSCMWFPFSIDRIKGPVNLTTPYGRWGELPTPSKWVREEIVWITPGVDIQIPSHVQSYRGEYLNWYPYTRHTLRLQPWGVIEIPFCNITSRKLFFDIAVDICTGVGRLRLAADKGELDTGTGGPAIMLPSRYATVGVNIPLTAYSGPSVIDFANAFSSAVTSAKTGNIGGTLEGSIGVVDALYGGDVVGTTLSSGSKLGIEDVAYFDSVFTFVADDDIYRFGQPLAKIRKIEELPGFIMCEDPALSCSALSSETSEILQYMREGFFYE